MVSHVTVISLPLLECTITKVCTPKLSLNLFISFLSDLNDYHLSIEKIFSLF